MSQPYERSTRMRMKSLIGTAVVLLIAGSLVVPRLLASEAVLVGDVTINSFAPAKNYNTSTAAETLNVAPREAGLVQFNLSAYAPSTALTVAYMQIFVDQVSLAGTLNFTLLTSSWNEASVTYATRPSKAATR